MNDLKIKIKVVTQSEKKLSTQQVRISGVRSALNLHHTIYTPRVLRNFKLSSFFTLTLVHDYVIELQASMDLTSKELRIHFTCINSTK